MVCRVEVIGGPVAVKNAKAILYGFDYSWKEGNVFFCDDYAPRLLQELGYKIVEKKCNLQPALGATAYIKLHGENLPPLEDQVCLAVMWASGRFWSRKAYLLKTIERLNSLL